MKLIATTLLDELAVKAAQSPRRRAHHNLHESPTDALQRFIVVALRDSYVRPHRHWTKSELVTVIRGRFEMVIFDDAGNITERCFLGEGTANMAYELPRGTMHTLLPLTDGAAFLEVKEGPYDPATAAEFAEWAPAEGSAGIAQFQKWVGKAPVGSRAPG
ncbi:MAG: WbuC family cupin fold metalloprotein [Steroidobacter sp.]